MEIKQFKIGKLKITVTIISTTIEYWMICVGKKQLQVIIMITMAIRLGNDINSNKYNHNDNININ